MINSKDVIRLKIPYPNISSNLAMQAHMYICYEVGNSNKLIKAQTYKPILETYVNSFIDSNEYTGEHPFKRRTLIDLDKYFYLTGVMLPISLKVYNNNGRVSDRLFNDITKETNQLNNCHCENVNIEQLKALNRNI